MFLSAKTMSALILLIIISKTRWRRGKMVKTKLKREKRIDVERVRQKNVLLTQKVNCRNGRDGEKINWRGIVEFCHNFY